MGLLEERLMKGERKDVMHSSAYGVAQNDGAFGTASSQGFDQRMRIDQNRQTIGKYSEAQVVNEVGRKEKIAGIHERSIGGEMSGSAGNGGAQQGTSNYGATLQGSNSRSSYGVRGATGAKPAASTNMGMRPLPGSRAAGAGAASRPPARRNPGIFR